MLPGGVLRDAQRWRSYRFRAASGRLEMVLNDLASSAQSEPAKVTYLLTAALEEVGGQPVDEALVWDLSVGDRQFLMRRLAIHLGQDLAWYSANCSRCANRFDFQIQESALPVVEAEGEFPLTRVALSSGAVQVRALTGRDQLLVADEPDLEVCRHTLAQCCLQPLGALPQGPLASWPSLPSADILMLEEALDALGPHVALTLQAPCPECELDNSVAADPYRLLQHPPDAILNEVYVLASHFHWSEAEILELPFARRRQYLQLIDRGKGFKG